MKPDLLQGLFARHFSNPEKAVRKFNRNLQTAALPFDVTAHLREIEYPPQPAFESGLPSWVYYYVPGTSWGSYRGQPTNALDPNFVYSGDGMGLNMGCPVRLAKALELLFSLPEQAQKACLGELRNVHKHLPTVEELIWPTLWLGKSELCRGGDVESNRPKIDWFFFAKGVPIYLEAQFRPSDWPSVTDMGTHQRMKDFFLGKAAKQFPWPRGPLTMHVVGVTGTSEPTPDMLAQCEDELANSPTMHAILYRTLLGSVHVVTLDQAKAPVLAALVKTPALGNTRQSTNSFGTVKVGMNEYKSGCNNRIIQEHRLQSYTSSA